MGIIFLDGTKVSYFNFFRSSSDSRHFFFNKKIVIQILSMNFLLKVLKTINLTSGFLATVEKLILKLEARVKSCSAHKWYCIIDNKFDLLHIVFFYQDQWADRLSIDAVINRLDNMQELKQARVKYRPPPKIKPIPESNEEKMCLEFVRNWYDRFRLFFPLFCC